MNPRSSPMATKSTYFRRLYLDLFKSNFDLLNPLHNPMLQDPDGVGVSGLNRGDKAVQKWRISHFKVLFHSSEEKNTKKKEEVNVVRKALDKGEVRNVSSNSSDGYSSDVNLKQSSESVRSEVSELVYADGKRWGFYPGLRRHLSFSDVVGEFFREGCELRVFMVWNSPAWMFSVRHQRGLESLLSRHKLV